MKVRVFMTAALWMVGVTLCAAVSPAGAQVKIADTYWRDVHDFIGPSADTPLVPGCHYRYPKDGCARNTSDGQLGDLCVVGPGLGHLLIELNSNPLDPKHGANVGVCHTHKGNVGKPLLWDCRDACRLAGKVGGVCVAENVAPRVIDREVFVGCHSAKCECGGPGTPTPLLAPTATATTRRPVSPARPARPVRPIRPSHPQSR